ncbi:MAG: permease-like cell division protein FtsX [Endozoicomonas sp.]
MSLFPRKNRRNKDGSRKVTSDDMPSSFSGGAHRQTAEALTLRSLFDLHRQMFTEAYRRLAKTPVASLMNCLLIAVAFSLPALLYLLIDNLQQLGENWSGQSRISVYLNHEVDQNRVRSLLNEAEQLSGMKQAVYISPEQGLSEFQAKAGLGPVIGSLGFNPLPGVIQLTPDTTASYQQLERVAQRYEQMPEVSLVRLDRQWVLRLQAILGMIERVVITFGLLLAFTVVLVISNTIRLNIESRRGEIRVIKMVGGTGGFITLPFLYMGAWYGAAGALLAQLVVFLVLVTISGQVLELAGLYGSGWTLHGPGIALFAALFLSGVGLGVLGAAVSCYRHIQVLNPE